jgi:hypothetical protein
MRRNWLSSVPSIYLRLGVVLAGAMVLLAGVASRNLVPTWASRSTAIRVVGHSGVAARSSQFTFHELPNESANVGRPPTWTTLAQNPAALSAAKAAVAPSLARSVGLRAESPLPATQQPAPAPSGPRSLNSHDSVLLFNSDNTGNATGLVEPPDTQLAAGPSSIIEMVNTTVGIFQKSNFAKLSQKYEGTFFGMPVTEFPTDARVVFDSASGRFFASELGIDPTAAGSSTVFLAVSGSSDPTGSWTVYQIVNVAGVCDQPTLGYSSDKVTVGCNEYTFSPTFPNNPTFQGTDTVVASKADLTAAAALHTIAFGLDNTQFTVEPVTSLTSTTTQFLVASGNVGLSWVEAITGVPPAATTLFKQSVGIVPLSLPPSAHQPSTTQIDTGDPRYEGAIWQNGALWTTANDGCTRPGSAVVQACLRLIQFNTNGWNPGVSGSPTNARDVDYVNFGGDDLYYAAVTADPAGNLYLAFSESSATRFVGAVVQSIPVCGTGSAAFLQKGVAAYPGFNNEPVARWGDYSSSAMDPADPSRAWTTAEFAATQTVQAQWGTVTSQVVDLIPDGGRPYTGGHDAIGVGTPGTDAYFAEGYTGANFDEYITIQNPGASQTLTADYLLASGTVITKTYSLPANSRTTLLANAEVGPCESVSAHLHAPSPFVAERPMYFDYNSVITGGHDAVGAKALGGTFYFGEGYTGPGFTEYLTLANPDPSTDSHVTVTYFFNGLPSKPVAHVVPAHSRATILVNDPAEAGPNQSVSAQVQVTSGPNILAERPMYFNYQGKWTGGSDVIGATALSTHLDLAEGYVASNFDEWLTILNPQNTAANLTITYNLTGGGTKQVMMTVPANSRGTHLVNSDFGVPTSQSIHIDSSVPVVVERPMYFSYASGNIQNVTGGHDAVAVDSATLGSSYSFAEGFVAPNFDEYLTVENNNSVPVTVTITYLLTGGGTQPEAPVVVPANSRYTRLVNSDFGVATSQSVQVTSTGGSILVERPMYFAF